MHVHIAVAIKKDFFFNPKGQFLQSEKTPDLHREEEKYQ